MSKVVDFDPTVCNKTRNGEWSNLPYDLLSRIADELGLIEFLSFRGVCKDWRNAATLKANSHGDNKLSFGCDPWFLLYGGGEYLAGSQCSLLSSKDNKVYYAIDNIPELVGATCLASYEGWLLVFRDGSLFFFCPFSRSKIELPNCPFTKVTDHIAAFSSAPTSHDCIVVVINHSNGGDYELELHMLCRGDNIWAKHNVSYKKRFLSKATRVALFIEGEFFFKHENGTITFDVNTKQWNKYHCGVVLFHMPKKANYISWLKSKLGLDENVSISTCGTLHPDASGKCQIIILSEDDIEVATDQFESPRLKGVWVLPRCHYIPPYQSW